MKLKNCLLLTAGILLSAFSQTHAESGQCGDSVHWTFENSVLTVFGQGILYGRPYEYLKDQIKTVIIDEGITGIAEGAFYVFDSITSVTFPRSLVNIDIWAFFSCSGLRTVITLNPIPPYIPSWEAFTSYGQITAHVPFGSLESYQSAHIWNWFGLVELDPVSDFVSATGVILHKDSLLLSKDFQFQFFAFVSPVDATNKNVIWQSDNPQVVTVSENGLVTAVSAGSAIISVTTADGGFEAATKVIVTEAGGICGDNLTWLLSDSVLTVSGTGSMWSLDEWQGIGIQSSFRKRIKTIILEEGLTSIDAQFFSNWTNLISVVIPESVTHIGMCAFENCYSLTSVTIPESVTSIGIWAFSYCYSLTSVYIPGNLTAIPNGCFEECHSLTSINIPESVTSIGEWAFAGTGLVSITIPRSVSRIGNFAFGSCHSLEKITVSYPEPIRIDPLVFYHVFNNEALELGSIILEVPHGCFSVYAGFEVWSEFNIVESPGSDATLKSLTLDNGISFLFSPDILDYKFDVKNVIDSITITAIPNDMDASATGAGKHPLAVGNNIFPVTVTAEDGTKMTYTLEIRRLNNDAALKSLTLNNGISFLFNPAILNYKFDVKNVIDSITITALPNDVYASATGAGQYPLVTGNNSFEITVTAEDGTERIYTVEVRRLNNDAALKSLTLNNGISFLFNPAIFNYKFNVENVIDSITITAIPNDIAASVTGAGKHPLAVGNNIFPVTVTAEDGTEKTYTVEIRRLQDATLKSLTLNNGNISFEFNPSILNYKFEVENNIYSITITAIPNDISASVTGAGKYSLVTGNNIFKITVTAEDGTEKTYTVEINCLDIYDRYPDLVYLENLTVSPGSLTPAFDRDTFDYTVQIPYPSDSITIEAMPGDKYSSVLGDGLHLLAYGENHITVIALKSGMIKKSYRISIYCEYPTRLAKNGKQPVQVYFDNNVLHLYSPEAEHINIYSVTGRLLYSFDKPAGTAIREGRVNPAPAPVLIVKGSSGWARKIVVND